MSDQKVASAYFYDCMIAGLLEVKQDLYAFRRAYFGHDSGQVKFDDKEIDRLFGNKDDNNIRPIWLAKGFLSPLVAVVAKRQFDLLGLNDEITFKPTLMKAQNFFPFELTNITISARDGNHGLYYAVGATIYMTTVDLIRRRIPVNVAVALALGQTAQS